VVKLGEEAQISLDRFTLKGPERANLRNSVSRGMRDGLSVELVEKERLIDLMPELALISATWLRSNGLREKAFSLGAFRPRFVAGQNVAVVRKGNRLIAFATIMTTETKTEAVIDLMRHLPEAPRSTMDFLFVQLIERYKAEGFASFSLGMAPLAGFASHPRASRWHRLGHLVYSHGEPFYNFQGLRAFKEKFAPVWQPRYLAAPSGLATYLALGDAAALINGGIRGMLVR
jgi:phosphatidylglycerol lysyltransferase